MAQNQGARQSIADIYRDITRRISAELNETQPDFSRLRQKVRHQTIDFLHWVERGKVVGPNGQILTVGPAFLTAIDDDTDRPTLFNAATGLVGNEWPSINRETEVDLSPAKRFLRPIWYVKRITRMANYAYFVILSLLGTYFVLDWSYSELESFSAVATRTIPSYVFLAYALFAITFVFTLGSYLLGVSRRDDKSESGSLDGLRGFTVIFEEARYKEYLSIVAVDDEEVEPSNAEKAVARQIVDSFDRGEKFTRSEFLDLKTSHGMRVRAFGRAWERAREERPEIGRPGRRTKS